MQGLPDSTGFSATSSSDSAAAKLPPISAGLSASAGSRIAAQDDPIQNATSAPPLSAKAYTTLDAPALTDMPASSDSAESPETLDSPARAQTASASQTTSFSVTAPDQLPQNGASYSALAGLRIAAHADPIQSATSAPSPSVKAGTDPDVHELTDTPSGSDPAESLETLSSSSRAQAASASPTTSRSETAPSKLLQISAGVSILAALHVAAHAEPIQNAGSAPSPSASAGTATDTHQLTDTPAGSDPAENPISLSSSSLAQAANATPTMYRSDTASDKLPQNGASYSALAGLRIAAHADPIRNAVSAPSSAKAGTTPDTNALTDTPASSDRVESPGTQGSSSRASRERIPNDVPFGRGFRQAATDQRRLFGPRGIPHCLAG